MTTQIQSLSKLSYTCLIFEIQKYFKEDKCHNIIKKLWIRRTDLKNERTSEGPKQQARNYSGRAAHVVRELTHIQVRNIF